MVALEFQITPQIRAKIASYLRITLLIPLLRVCCIMQSRLYFCASFAWLFRPVVPIGELLFIQGSTNATDDHKYSPFPSQILTVPKFWYHLAHSFWRKNEAQEMTPKLLALAKVSSVLGNIRDISWHLSKRGNELEKRWTFSILDKTVHKVKPGVRPPQWPTGKPDCNYYIEKCLTSFH